MNMYLFPLCCRTIDQVCTHLLCYLLWNYIQATWYSTRAIRTSRKHLFIKVTSVHIITYIYSHTLIYAHTHSHTSAYSLKCTPTHMYSFTYIHSHTHTYILIYMYSIASILTCTLTQPDVVAESAVQGLPGRKIGSSNPGQGSSNPSKVKPMT